MRKYYNEDYELGYEDGRRDALLEAKKSEPTSYEKGSFKIWEGRYVFFLNNKGLHLFEVSGGSDKLEDRKALVEFPKDLYSAIFGKPKVKETYYREDIIRLFDSIGFPYKGLIGIEIDR